MNRKIFILWCTTLLLVAPLAAQAQPFADEIAAFRKQDSLQFPPRHSILLIGSSSFRLWKDVQAYFPGYPMVNRGFGGSTLSDQVRYVKEVVYPYDPKQVLIYCGENDIASSDSITPKRVLERFTQLFGLIRERYPDVPVLFVSIKPSPSRTRYQSKVKEANKLIRKFLKKKKKTVFVDVYTPMLDEKGQPNAALFLNDNLHMNADGYAIWQKLIEPHLLK